MRKTKIVCTMGPATEDDSVLEQLITGGMDVARLNFSHGTHEIHKKTMDRIKRLREKAGIPVAILLDTKGPEIRLGNFKDGFAELMSGQLFTLKAHEIEGNAAEASITYADLYKDINENTRILIDDGLVEMSVERIEDTDIVCRVINGGRVSDKKGINVPGVELSMPYVSEIDKKDILFGIEQDVDFIAASFVRQAADVIQIRKILNENGGEDIKIISKIENGQGVKNIDEIIENSDGIMVARGDMGVEIPGEDVPVIQKMIIKKVYKMGKQVITATQMLDSMMKNPRPTRAETADVANAIYDGTSAIMLSGETAAGAYPVEALRTMVRIAERTQEDIDYRKRFFNDERSVNPDITDAICHATCTTALDINAKAIITVTMTGRSARMISRYRPESDVLGCTTNERVSRQLSLCWGVHPVKVNEKQEVFGLFEHAVEVCKNQGFLEEKDVVVITSGVPIGFTGTTNMIKVQVVN